MDFIPTGDAIPEDGIISGITAAFCEVAAIDVQVREKSTTATPQQPMVIADFYDR